MFIAQPSALEIADDTSMFDLAPVSLWLEDASDVKRLFESWRDAGMVSLREALSTPENMIACLGHLKILRVNQKTLDLFETADFSAFLAILPKLVTPRSLECLIEQWVQLWEGATTFCGKTINMTATGRPLDVQIRGILLPGHEQSWQRVLVTIEDVTDLETARREATASAFYARGLFEHSPVALCVKDFSGVKGLLSQLQETGISDLAAYLHANPAFALSCLEAVKVVELNRQALDHFAVADKDDWVSMPRWRTDHQYRAELTNEIVGLWNGKLFQQRESIDRTLDGREVHVHIQLSVLPGYEADWAKVQIARINIDDRKRAEDRLRYVSTHDPVTQLYNRRFFIETLESLDASSDRPVTVVTIDLNGLKPINDTVGHAAGDDLLRRMGGILLDVVHAPACAARIGGDEFSIVMPNAGEAEGQAMINMVENLVALDNQATPAVSLSLSIGVATQRADERLESVVSRSDRAMYERKAAFYAEQRALDPNLPSAIRGVAPVHDRHYDAAPASSSATSSQ